MANRTRTQLANDSLSLFPNNTSQLISPQDLRDWITNGIDSFVTQKDASSLQNVIYESDSTSVTAGSTTNLALADGNFVHISGSPTTINSFGNLQAGTRFVLVFDDAYILTYNATSLIIPGSANKTTAAGDACLILSEGSGNWRIVGYFPISGSTGGGITALTGDVTASGTGSVTATIANGAVDIGMLSATGSPSSGNFLRGDYTWAIPAAAYTSTVQHQVKLDEAINKGQAVYVYGANGTNMLVRKASNTSEATSSKTMGLIDASGATNALVNVITEGLLAGLDTSTAGAAGDPVWLGVNGDLIYGLVNKPYAPDHLVFIGIVTRKNASNGEIFVKVQNGFELKEIHDVQAQTPSLNDTLYYDNTTSPAQWKTAQINTIAPSASATVTGLVNTTTQEFAGIKTFGNGTSAGEIRIKEPSGSGSNSIGIKAQAIGSDYDLTLPTTAGVAGYVIQTDGSGNLSWVNNGGGTILQYLRNFTAVTLTPTATETIVTSILIPANTFSAGQGLMFNSMLSYPSSGVGVNIFFKINSANNLSGALQLYTATLAGSILQSNVSGFLTINSGSPNNTTRWSLLTPTGYGTGTPPVTLPTDWSIAQYLIISATGSSKTVTVQNMSITPL